MEKMRGSFFTHKVALSTALAVVEALRRCGCLSASAVACRPCESNAADVEAREGHQVAHNGTAMSAWQERIYGR
jgi:hypothetical protein